MPTRHGAVEGLSLAERLALLREEDRGELLGGLDDEALAALYNDWAFWARGKQLPPAGAWFCWAVIAGRGFGKTRTGAEWVRSLMEAAAGRPAEDPLRLALVAETLADARDVMVDGESGVLAVSQPDWMPAYEPSKRRLIWPNGSVAVLYSADDPEQLRGPQHHFAWCDELAKFRHGEAVWSNLLLGLRLGERPRVLVTTTPRPTRLVKDIISAPSTVVVRGTTYENRSFLPAAFFEQVVSRYEGTRLGRQELNAEIIDDVPGALWSRRMIERARVSAAPGLRRIVVAVDPPGSQSGTCGIIVAGVAADGTGYVLEDASMDALSPLAWGETAAAAYHRFAADRLIAEVNQGGDMVATVIQQVDAGVAFRAVRARRGKGRRAEPVAALYEQNRVCHVGALPALEDQLCALTPDFDVATAGFSPDRADALVWALTELMLGLRREPQIRSLR